MKRSPRRTLMLAAVTMVLSVCIAFAAAETQVNINTASYDELVQVKGIGPKIAAQIIEVRDKNGPFTDINGLLVIQQIGPKNLDKMKPYLKVE